MKITSALMVAVVTNILGAPALAVTMAAGAVAIDSFVDVLGPRWVAVFFAIIAASWRWFHFSLPVRQGVAGLMLPAAFAFATGEGSLPLIGQFFIEMDPISRTMWNGLVLGLFIVMAFGIGQDFMTAYAARKAKGP